MQFKSAKYWRIIKHLKIYLRCFVVYDPYGTRTRVAGVKGRSPRPLDEGAAEQIIVQSVGDRLISDAEFNNRYFGWSDSFYSCSVYQEFKNSKPEQWVLFSRLSRLILVFQFAVF